MKKLLTILLISLSTGSTSLLTAGESPSGPDVVLRQLWTEIRTQRVQASGNTDNFIQSALDRHYDFDSFYQVSLQDHWDGWAPAQRDSFGQKFKTLFLRSLSSKIQKLPATGGELILRQVNINGDRAEILCTGRKGTREASFRIFFSRRASYWKIYDVEVEGVLLSRNYRGQFNRILRQEGYDALLARFDRKLAEQGGSI